MEGYQNAKNNQCQETISHMDRGPSLYLIAGPANFTYVTLIPFCQNGTFEPVHESQKFFCPKDFFEAL